MLGERVRMLKNIISGVIVAAILTLSSWLAYIWLTPPSVVIRVGNGIVDLEKAPFEISIIGTVSHAKDKYLYLVVDDKHAEWIEPNLGYGYNGEFYGTAYLGNKDDENSLNKWYSVFAVVVDKEHNKFSHLDKKAIKAKSEIIRLYRVR
jgi:hypothetical protein